MPEIDLTRNPDDPEKVRAAKDILKYGDHLKDCDRSNEQNTDPDKQHMCCRCGWCVVSEGYRLTLMFYEVGKQATEKHLLFHRDRKETKRG